ncbi:hypothetical protein LPJ68_005236, partial [Coemansia sp. RSA 1086]
FDNSGAVMNVNEELLCSFEILKPLTENLHTCMARIEASFWSRRQQVEAMLNEALAAQAKKELDEAQQQQPPDQQQPDQQPGEDQENQQQPIAIQPPQKQPKKSPQQRLPSRSPKQRIVDQLDLSDDDDDSSSGRLPVSPESVLHGTPPRGSKLKMFP